MPKTKKLIEAEPTNKVTAKVETKGKRKLNLGETYGDNSFQITTEKMNKAEEAEEAEIKQHEIEKEVQKLPIHHRNGKFGFSEYLVFFGILLFGIVIGTVMSLHQIKTSFYRTTAYSSYTQDLISSGDVKPGVPTRMYPATNTTTNNETKMMGSNTAPTSTTKSKPTTSANQTAEFNNGNYKVYQKADGSLVIVW